MYNTRQSYELKLSVFVISKPFFVISQIHLQLVGGPKEIWEFQTKTCGPCYSVEKIMQTGNLFSFNKFIMM